MIEALVDRLPKEEWSEAALAFADYGLYQTWDYGEQRAAREGSLVSRIVVRRNGTTIGMAQCRIKSVPLTGLGIAYLHWSPMWRRAGATAEDLGSTLSAIRQEYAERRGLLVRVAPRIVNNDQSRVLLRALTEARFFPSRGVKPYRTFILNLRPPMEELQRAMARRWKRALKRPEARQVHIVAGYEHELFVQFLPLYDDIHQRKHFTSAVDPRVFQEIQRQLLPTDKMQILLAFWEDRPVAGLISSYLGDTCLGLLGASDEAGRRCQAAYLLHRENIQRAKAAGLEWYDLGGIDPEGNPDGYLFKAGLGGEDCEFIGEFEANKSSLGKTALCAAETAYRWLKGCPR